MAIYILSIEHLTVQGLINTNRSTSMNGMLLYVRVFKYSWHSVFVPFMFNISWNILII